MGVARLLAKGWLVFCVFAGAHALHISLMQGVDPANALEISLVPVALFSAMGLLFIGGFGASGLHGGPLFSRLKAAHLIPGFNELVFVRFTALCFVYQGLISPG